MLKNYLKIAARNFVKYKAYSFINIAGLAIGIACCILILLYVQDELSCIFTFHFCGVQKTLGINNALDFKLCSKW